MRMHFVQAEHDELDINDPKYKGKWRSDTPPKPGFYVASLGQDSGVARYWDGTHWRGNGYSASVLHRDVEVRAQHKYAPPERDPIMWRSDLNPYDLWSWE